jgi:hypothetical protein
MSDEIRTASGAEVLEEVSRWGVAGGILLTALAPLSLPFVILTVVALLPLIVPLLAAGLLVAVVAVPVLLIRKVGSSLRKLAASRRGKPEPAPRPAGQL